MTTTGPPPGPDDGPGGPPPSGAVSEPSWGRRLSAALRRHPRTQLSLLLSAPLLWLVVAYLGSLSVLFLSAFWSVDTFTGDVVYEFTLDNFSSLFESEVYRAVTMRSIGVAALVTVIDTVIAFPVAFYMAKVATPRVQRLLVIAILTPLWASYLVKAYAWRVMLSGDGPLNWALGPFGLDGPGYGFTATVLTLSYLWLPFMILPIFAGLERVPNSLLDASGDLGARAGRTFRSVVLPMTLPAVAAGSIFTFSLSLGDYIAVQIVGGSTQLLGNVVYANIGSANNLPFAAALATIPVAIMMMYLLAVRRTGALEQI
ncbi:MAG: ABC transporter permease [Actinomycetes bacterium]